AIVGRSGSGKTTLVDLICRFQSPSSGRMLMDGVDIRDIRVDSFRHTISILSQEPALLHDTSSIKSFLTEHHADDEKIITACQQANVWSFISEMDAGLDTVIGEAGGKLSGGQRQRIVLARALYHDAPILILDEATSALDSESEDMVQKSIGNLGRDKTIIIIAHRLQTIRNVDLIVVLEDGAIIESGSHEDLMSSKGTYSRFVELQSF